MKAILEFNLSDPDEREAHLRAVKVNDAYCALWEIAQDVFRPARKHGYPDLDLNELLKNEQVEEAISLLEKKFYQILEDREIVL